MSATQRDKQAESNKDSATPNERHDHSSADDTGGAPATEEDVGTEGAGTEPRQSVDVERDTGTSRRKTRDA